MTAPDHIGVAEQLSPALPCRGSQGRPVLVFTAGRPNASPTIPGVLMAATENETGSSTVEPETLAELEAEHPTEPAVEAAFATVNDLETDVS